MSKPFACYRVKPQFEEAEMLACKGISATRTIDAVNCISGFQNFFEEYVPVFLAERNVYRTHISRGGNLFPQDITVRWNSMLVRE